MDRQRRIEVYRQTFDIVRKNGYEVNGKKITLPREDDERMQQGTVFYDKEFHVEAPTINGHTDVRVVNEDCLVAAKELIDEGYHVAVLNMASRRNPGGGVTGGSGAQEENLFRRSNYFLSLYQFAPYAEEYGIRKSTHQYPLDRTFGGIYTPDATVFRDTEAANYRLLEQPYHVSFIAVPALNRPELDRNGLIVRKLIEPFKTRCGRCFALASSMVMTLWFSERGAVAHFIVRLATWQDCFMR